MVWTNLLHRHMDLSSEGDNSDEYGAGQSTCNRQTNDITPQPDHCWDVGWPQFKQTGPLNKILCDSDTGEYISEDQSCDETRFAVCT